MLVWMLRSALIGRCTEILRRLRARRAVVGEKVGSVLEGLCSIRLSFVKVGGVIIFLLVVISDLYFVANSRM